MNTGHYVNRKYKATICPDQQPQHFPQEVLFCNKNHKGFSSKGYNINLVTPDKTGIYLTLPRGQTQEKGETVVLMRCYW